MTAEPTGPDHATSGAIAHDAPPSELGDAQPGGRRPGSARLRLTLLLTLALLPLGLISVLQAREVAGQAREMSERALLGETLRAAAAQREVIRTAQGQALALVPLVRGLAGNPAACSALMAQVVEAAQAVRFAGFVDRQNRLACVSDGSARDLPGTALHGSLQGGPTVRTGSGLLLDGDAMVVVQPVRKAAPKSVAQGPEPGSEGDESRYLGAILLALPPTALLAADPIPGAEDTPLEVTTLDRSGTVLWASPNAPGMVLGLPEEARAAGLPATIPLSDLVGEPAHAFTASAGDGTRRAYAVVPVIEGEIVTLGAWQPGSLFDDAGSSGAAALGALLPLAMWGLSLLVAFVAVNRLILSPLSALRGRMQAFTAGTRVLPPLGLTSAPAELRDLADTFDAMTARIVSDETRLEKAVHDQHVLLKEVHHRVKNNLQLIASILNMQIRQHRSPESRAVLRRVQDRVMSLATVHQHLYQTPALSALRADALLGEIVNRKIAEAGTLGSKLAVTTRLAPVRLYPDQAVPLALLVGEAVTNVFHHVGAPPDGARPWMEVLLSERSGRAITLVVSNSGGARLTPDQSEHRAGLGTRLIDAFASQLDATLDREPGDADGTAWTLTLRFKAEAFRSGAGGEVALGEDDDPAGATGSAPDAPLAGRGSTA